MPRSVGVLAIQGDFERHLDAIARCEAEGREVRTPEELEQVDRLIIPGGESTTVGLLLQRYGLGEAIRQRAESGMPIWGTCMGMILMAGEIEGSDQYRLELLDIAVRRNAFGAQVHSFEAPVEVLGLDSPLTAVFIRAPLVTRLGGGVEAIGHVPEGIVAVRQGVRLGTSFHPELTEDDRLLRQFLAFRAP